MHNGSTTAVMLFHIAQLNQIINATLNQNYDNTFSVINSLYGDAVGNS